MRPGNPASGIVVENVNSDEFGGECTCRVIRDASDLVVTGMVPVAATPLSAANDEMK